MEKESKVKNFMLAAHVGRTKKLYEAGHSAAEIAEKLNQPESSVREWISMIEEAESKKNNK